MKNICMIFQVHQPALLKRYRFFDICNDPYYYDDFENERIIKTASADVFLPTNDTILGLIKKYGSRFKVAFSISGTALDLFQLFAPEVIESFRRLALTGSVEFLAETYSHSLASIKNRAEFIFQAQKHAQKIKELFGQYPVVFKNTELVYSDEIGEIVSSMGFKAILTEGERQLLKSKSPNHLYCHPANPELIIMLRNNRLSEDIGFRMENADWTGWPAIENNYLSILNRIPHEEQIVNLFMDYEVIGKGQKQSGGVYNFLKSFPAAIFEMTDYGFMTPSEIINHYEPFSELNVTEIISRTDNEGGDLMAWLGNDLQQEAFEKLYSIRDKVEKCTDQNLLKDWQLIQSTDHFYFMCSKFFSNKEISDIKNPYNNPYEAFMNYMNVLHDFIFRLNRSMLTMKSDFVQKKLHNTEVNTAAEKITT